ncbi:hypothetical protein D3C74_377170 [compost metagenome]
MVVSACGGRSAKLFCDWALQQFCGEADAAFACRAGEADGADAECELGSLWRGLLPEESNEYNRRYYGRQL